jgi:hypothetical protein
LAVTTNVAPIIAYASRTGTRRNLDALRARGWRLLVSATGTLSHEGFPYALDNGAWTAFQKKQPFDGDRFGKALLLLGDRADFVVVPDVVGGGLESLRFSLSWLPHVLDYARVALIPVQDGMELADVTPHLIAGRVGLFIGGSPDTDFKERTAPMWARACREVGSWCHMGRVNSKRRIAICATAGVTSFDGTSATRYSCQLPKLHRAVVQGSLLLETNDRKGDS